jgi:gamma-glutamylcyclotransferase (GGCT)/AIG2-like uncharacterized protein YtfP
MKKNKYILSGTAFATILTIVTLLRDVLDFKLRINDFVTWLQNPAIYWIFAIFVFLIGILIGTKLASQRHKGESIRVFDLSNATDAELFYKELCRSYRDAQSEIYLTGKGFISDSDNYGEHISALLKATKKALDNQVNIVRIQMSNNPAEEWADRFAALMQSYPNKLKVYADYESTELANTAIIDPNGSFPMVQLLFEIEETGIKAQKLDVALFIYGRRDLAKSLQKQFILRIGMLQQLLPNEMRELGLGIYYFAYGSNICSSQMRERCPNAKKIGVGVLYGWELDFAVNAPHLRGNVAGIYRSPSKYVWGIVYVISKQDKEALDKTEQGGYYPVEVSIKMQDSQQHLNKVFVYIPEKPRNSAVKPDAQYLEVVLEGANEHGIRELIDMLESVKQSM